MTDLPAERVVEYQYHHRDLCIPNTGVLDAYGVSVALQEVASFFEELGGIAAVPASRLAGWLPDLVWKEKFEWFRLGRVS